MSQDIVTAFMVNVSSSSDREPNTEPLQSTTLNVPALHSCYLCWRHAERIYQTTAFKWHGQYFPSEERPLCRLHWLLALGVHLESVFIRKQVNEEVEAEDYEPYYSRADEQSDLANADYYDEIARGVA